MLYINNCRPVQFYNTSGQKQVLKSSASKPKRSDFVSFNGSLTPLEQKLMQEVVRFTEINGVETARIIGKSGKELLNLEHSNNQTNCSARVKDELKIFGWDIENKTLRRLAKRIKYIFYIGGSTMVHSHPRNTPISYGDVNSLFNSNERRIIAGSPNGSYSLVDRQRGYLGILFYKFLHKKKINNALGKFKESIQQLSAELGVVTIDAEGKQKNNYLDVTDEILEEYNRRNIKLLEEFVDATACRLEHNFDV